MSGWDVRQYSAPAFGLTFTKAHYWHRRCPCQRWGGMDWLASTHLAPAGLTVLKVADSYLHVTWPGVVAGHSTEGTDPLYAAVIGGGNEPAVDRCADPSCRLPLSAPADRFGFCPSCRHVAVLDCLVCDVDHLADELDDEFRCAGCRAAPPATAE